MIPFPICPRSRAKRFADPKSPPRFLHDYRMTVSDLWIDGHYPRVAKFLNRYGISSSPKPATAAIRARIRCVPWARWTFRAASSGTARSSGWSRRPLRAAHIYGRQIVDAESFTGWRQLAGRPA